MFGAQSTGTNFFSSQTQTGNSLFNTQPQSQQLLGFGQLFNTQPQQQLFQGGVSSGGLFNQQNTSSNQIQNQLQVQQIQQQQQNQITQYQQGYIVNQIQQQNRFLFQGTKDNGPITYKTPWSSLSENTQNYLLKIEDQIAQNRHYIQDLKKQQQNYAGYQQQQKIDELKQNLQGKMSLLDKDCEAKSQHIVKFKEKVYDLLTVTDMTYRIFMRNKLWRDQQKDDKMLAQYMQIPVTSPHPYLPQIFDELNNQLGKLSQQMNDLEQSDQDSVLQKRRKGGEAVNMYQILDNLNEYLFSIANIVGQTNDKVEVLKNNYLQGERTQGNYYDPFSLEDNQQQDLIDEIDKYSQQNQKNQAEQGEKQGNDQNKVNQQQLNTPTSQANNNKQGFSFSTNSLQQSQSNLFASTPKTSAPQSFSTFQTPNNQQQGDRSKKRMF